MDLENLARTTAVDAEKRRELKTRILENRTKLRKTEHILEATLHLYKQNEGRWSEWKIDGYEVASLESVYANVSRTMARVEKMKLYEPGKVDEYDLVTLEAVDALLKAYI